MNFGKRFIGTEVQQLMLSIAAMMVSLIAAVTLCYLVERPALRAARRLSLSAQNRAAFGRT